MTDCPPLPPRKRRQLQAADPVHLAIWASDENLSLADRKRAQDERDRRKGLRTVRVVGVLEGKGGANPTQVEKLEQMLRGDHPTLVLHPFVSKRVHGVCLSVDASLEVVGGGPTTAAMSTARRADVLIGLPVEASLPEAKDGPFWGVLRWAKDRDVDVRVIWSSGGVLGGRW